MSHRNLLTVFVVGAALSVFSAAILTLAFRGDVAQGVFALGAVLFIAPPLALVGGIVTVSARRRGDATTAQSLRTGGFFLGLALGLIAHLPALAVGSVLAARDVAHARAFLDTLVPRLDAHHAQHGRYPDALDSVHAVEEPLPRLLRRYPPYHPDADGQTFSFGFTDPRGMMHGYEYDSTTRQWVEWD